jgi:hypothetical protein
MFHVLAILITLLTAQATPTLDDVLSRATAYVSQYESDLGNLIGTEEYSQSSQWLDNSVPPRVAKRAQRRTTSDFLIIQVGQEWTALRKITRVDGIKTKEKPVAFEDAFEDSPEANAKRLHNMKQESAEQNLGDVQREINLPTFALKILRKSEVSRFSFERAGTAKIDGIQTWKIRFKEQTGRTLVSGAKGESLYSTGTLWIEPETGRVIQTELHVENPYAVLSVKGEISVTYGTSKKVQILVPTTMIEHYESRYNNVDCRADYSNFRPFEVSVQFEIAAPQP